MPESRHASLKDFTSKAVPVVANEFLGGEWSGENIKTPTLFRIERVGRPDVSILRALETRNQERRP